MRMTPPPPDEPDTTITIDSGRVCPTQNRTGWIELYYEPEQSEWPTPVDTS